MTETLEELIAAMSQARAPSGGWGKVVGGHGTIDLEYEVAVETAKSILYNILRWDQAYDRERMPPEVAIDFTERFFRCFEDSTLRCFTNGEFETMNGREEFIRQDVLYPFMMRRDSHDLIDRTTGHRLTNAEFAAAIGVVTPQLSGYCFVEDTD